MGFENHVPDNRLFAVRLFFFWQHEIVERAVEFRELAQSLAGDQVDFFQGAIQHLKPPQITVITKEIAKKTGRDFCPLRSVYLSDSLGSSHQAVQREFAVIFYQLLDAIPFLAKHQGILELLRIKQWGKFREQRDNFISRDGQILELLSLQQFRPCLQPGFVLSFSRLAGADQLVCVFGRAKPAIKGRGSAGLWREGFEKLRGQSTNIPYRIGIVFETANQDVVFGLEIGVAAFFQKNELIEEDLIVSALLIAEERTPGGGQGLSVNLAQN